MIQSLDSLADADTRSALLITGTCSCALGSGQVHLRELRSISIASFPCDSISYT